MKPRDQLGPNRVVADLGAGGMGAVYRAHDTDLNRLMDIMVRASALALVVALGTACGTVFQDYRIEGYTQRSPPAPPKDDACEIEIFEVPRNAAGSEATAIVPRPHERTAHFDLVAVNTAVSLRNVARKLACRLGGDGIVFQELPTLEQHVGFGFVERIGPRARVWVIAWRNQAGGGPLLSPPLTAGPMSSPRRLRRQPYLPDVI